jgi:aspartate/methionine/tyrosine aminotransferase
MEGLYDHLRQRSQQALAQVALQVGEALAERSRGIVQHNLELADPVFCRWRAIFRWNRPQAGSVAFVGLRDRSAREFSDRLLVEQGVLLLPGPSMGFDDHHVRLGLGRLSFAAGLEQLDRYLAASSS